MLYAKSLEVAGHLYKIPDYLAHAEKIRERIRNQAMNGIFFVDHSVRENGQLELQTGNMTEVCQYYAFYFDVANHESDPELFQFLVENVSLDNKEAIQEVGLHPCNAFIGNYLRMEILSRHNLQKKLLPEIEEGFLTMANTTGTLWEHTKPTASCNHGFASHAGYVLVRDFGGIRRIDQVNKSIDILFTDNDLENCQLQLPIGNELFRLKWEKKGREIHYDLKAPAGYKVVINNNSGYSLHSASR
jgi:alpha-L-rhamnosidase